MKIKEILNNAKNNLIKNNIEDSGVISRVLLQYTLKCDRNELIIKEEEELKENLQKEYENYIEKKIPSRFLYIHSKIKDVHFLYDRKEKLSIVVD